MYESEEEANLPLEESGATYGGSSRHGDAGGEVGETEGSSVAHPPSICGMPLEWWVGVNSVPGRQVMVRSGVRSYSQPIPLSVIVPTGEGQEVRLRVYVEIPLQRVIGYRRLRRSVARLYSKQLVRMYQTFKELGRFIDPQRGCDRVVVKTAHYGLCQRDKGTVGLLRGDTSRPETSRLLDGDTP